jgi:hypothetical protein
MRHTYPSVVCFPTTADLGFAGTLPLGGVFGGIGILVIEETFELLIEDVGGICVSWWICEYKNGFLHASAPGFAPEFRSVKIDASATVPPALTLRPNDESQHVLTASGVQNVNAFVKKR